MSDVGIIQENDFLLIECNNIFVFLDRVTSFRKIKIHHAKFAASKIVGLPYGTVLEVVDGEIHEISEQQFANITVSGIADEPSANPESVSASSCDIAGDNRNLIAMPENQKLSETEIKNLKRTGFKGSEVVSFLVENSSTFNQKTVFSKEKYLKRKHKKHRIMIRLLKPSIPLLADWTTQRGRQRIGGLSTDTLSQILSYGNIYHGSRLVVFDNCGGLLLLSVIHRMGGSGLVLDLHTSSQPTRDVYRKVFDAVQMPQENLAVITPFPLQFTETLSQEEFTDNTAWQTDPETGAEGEASADREAATLAKLEKRNVRLDKLKATWTLLKQGNFDGLLIATRNDPLPVLKAYFDCVGLSRHIVVFHQHRELLTPCFNFLASTGRCVMSSIVSNLCREIQVLPGRTHPVIQMHGPSGYILFATKPSSPLVERYRGTLLSAIYELLDKAQSQGVSSKVLLDSGAASYLELFLFDVVVKICSRVKPQSATDLSENVVACFPEPIKGRYSEIVLDLFSSQPPTGIFGRHVSSSSNGATLVMPVDKIQNMLSRDILHTKIDHRLAKYLAALLQVIANDILVFVRCFVLELGTEVIGTEEVKTAISADHLFLSIFSPEGAGQIESTRSSSEADRDDESFDDQSVMSMSTSRTLGANTDNISIATMTPVNYPDEQPLDYVDQVKQLLTEESNNVRDLHMIVRLFKHPIDIILQDPVKSEEMFGNVDEVLIAAEAVLSTLEDTVEAAEENNTPLVGEAILELAGEAVFDVYRTYAETVLSPASQSQLTSYLHKQDVYQRLEALLLSSGKIRNYVDCFRYILPRLILKPLQHCWKFFEELETMVGGMHDCEDKNLLHQSVGVLHPLRARLTPYHKLLQRPHRMTRHEALEQVAQLGKQLESWPRDKPLQNCCTELIHEGPVFKQNDRTRRAPSERYLLLFDTLILLCKRSSSNRVSRQSSSAVSSSAFVNSHANYTYRVKEKLTLRNFRVTDLPDCPDYVNAFLIENYSTSESSTSSASPTMLEDFAHGSVSSATSASSLVSIGHVKGSYLLLASSPQEKQTWMYHLLWLLSKPSIDRHLDAVLNEPIVFHLPPSYRFSEADNPNNIIFEESSSLPGGGLSAGPPLVRGATLQKLIERLTFHEYSDTKFMKTFATTYRSFCKPHELLKLLIERFNIPEYSPDIESASIVFFESEEERRQATELRKFRKEYVKPVQFRVLNFFRHWILNHSYDFSEDPQLKDDLVDFVKSIRAPHLRRWVLRLLTHIEKIGTARLERAAVFDQNPPPIVHHLRDKPISLMTLHPVELARQVTLLEFTDFARIRPCELIGTPWMKSAKYETSPNVMRAIEFHNEFTFWLERNIIETKNLEERIAVCERIADVLAEFKRLNNFSGQFSVASAFSSGCVGRLALTLEGMKPEKKQLIDDATSLHENHNRRYAVELKMCNPPCVPFLGMWLSRLLHVEEGNKDYLVDGVINFSKWRRTAEYITEIQQYQNQPYCLAVENEIKEFFEHLDSKGGMDRDELEDYLYKISYEIEPKQRAASPTMFPRRFDFPLTAPPPPQAVQQSSIPLYANSTVSAASTAGTGISKWISRDPPGRVSAGLVSSQPATVGRKGSNRAVPLVLATSGSSTFDEGDSRSVLTGGSSSSSSLPSTPFPTPPSSASIGHQHFFAATSSSSSSSSAIAVPVPPLPPRPSEHGSTNSPQASNGYSNYGLVPPALPQRPIPSPSYQSPLSAGPLGASSMPPPLPPRNSAAVQPNGTRSRFEYPPVPQPDLLLPPTVPTHKRQSSQ